MPPSSTKNSAAQVGRHVWCLLCPRRHLRLLLHNSGNLIVAACREQLACGWSLGRSLWWHQCASLSSSAPGQLKLHDHGPWRTILARAGARRAAARRALTVPGSVESQCEPHCTRRTAIFEKFESRRRALTIEKACGSIAGGLRPDPSEVVLPPRNAPRDAQAVARARAQRCQLRGAGVRARAWCRVSVCSLRQSSPPWVRRLAPGGPGPSQPETGAARVRKCAMANWVLRLMARFARPDCGTKPDGGTNLTDSQFVSQLRRFITARLAVIPRLGLCMRTLNATGQSRVMLSPR